MSPFDLIPVGTKNPEPTPQTRLMDFPTLPTHLPEKNGKAHVSGDSDSDTSSSDSSSKKYNPSNDSNYSKPIKNKCDKKENCRKHKKQDMSESSSRDSDSSDNSDYRRKIRKKKSNRKKDMIKLCASIKEKLLTTAYKSNIIRFKLDGDPLQRQIYFLTFV